jgi:hypothetical protein
VLLPFWTLLLSSYSFSAAIFLLKRLLTHHATYAKHQHRRQSLSAIPATVKRSGPYPALPRMHLSALMMLLSEQLPM